MSEEPIKDISNYNLRMQQSLIDKIFFMDKIFDARFLIDYGCADGSLIFMLNQFFPCYYYSGYDFCTPMINSACDRLSELPENQKKFINFFSKWEFEKSNGSSVIEFKNQFGKQFSIIPSETCLLLSSIIHEIYSYGVQKVDEFWARIYELQPKYIVVRDMCVSKTASRSSDPISVARIRQCFDEHKISQWEARWGSLNENWSFTHFLLTYHYMENWEREYKENYLPICKESLLKMFPRCYRPVHIEHYTLPYLRNKIFNDFGVQLQERTHIKLIMEKDR